MSWRDDERPLVERIVGYINSDDFLFHLLLVMATLGLWLVAFSVLATIRWLIKLAFS